MLSAGNPLPKVLHVELSKAQIGSGRIIMIGDVHGCYDELRQLLVQCRFDQAADTLIFNGDMINKGPKSVEVACSSCCLRWLQVHEIQLVTETLNLGRFLITFGPSVHWLCGEIRMIRPLQNG